MKAAPRKVDYNYDAVLALSIPMVATARRPAEATVLVGYDDRYRQGNLVNARFFPTEEYQRTGRALFAKVQYLYRY